MIQNVLPNCGKLMIWNYDINVLDLQQVCKCETHVPLRGYSLHANGNSINKLELKNEGIFKFWWNFNFPGKI